jgi:N-acyl-D-aspartate/D-glutamate deacylase
MEAMYDLLIANGMLVDGTGLPRRLADVAIKDGRIAGIGRFAKGEARQTLDAEGRVVAPGIVDLHTHYDPQLVFEPYGTSSCYHGVTTVVAGNCGFSIAPTRARDRAYAIQMFARVEGMSLRALEGLPWDFETFPEYLAARRRRLGINLACYVGHCAVRYWVMGEAALEREASDAEIDAMRKLVAEAMAAGAAGFSSTHAPTHWDLADRPVPSRLSSHTELEALAREAARANAGTISYLPFSSVNGLQDPDKALLIRMARDCRLPVIIQGLGARSKVDAPTATWPESRKFVERASEDGAAVYSLIMARPLTRRFSLAEGTSLYEGVPAFQRLFSEARTPEQRMALARDPRFRAAVRSAVENPNRDSKLGPTLPPPQWDVLLVYRAARPENRSRVGRSLAQLARERGVAPMDAFLDLALSEDLATEFVWATETDEWREGTYQASVHPNMLIGTSDGGAHLDRDDGSEFSSYFLAHWVRDWGKWTLEEAIRRLTMLPAGLAGLHERGAILPGWAADLFVFDPHTIRPARKEFVRDFPNGQGRWTTRPDGVHATIVNGVPIVRDGELVPGCGYPGTVLSPVRPAP